MAGFAEVLNQLLGGATKAADKTAQTVRGFAPLEKAAQVQATRPQAGFAPIDTKAAQAPAGGFAQLPQSTTQAASQVWDAAGQAVGNTKEPSGDSGKKSDKKENEGAFKRAMVNGVLGGMMGAGGPAALNLLGAIPTETAKADTGEDETKEQEEQAAPDVKTSGSNKADSIEAAIKNAVGEENWQKMQKGAEAGKKRHEENEAEKKNQRLAYDYMTGKQTDDKAKKAYEDATDRMNESAYRARALATLNPGAEGATPYDVNPINLEDINGKTIFNRQDADSLNTLLDTLSSGAEAPLPFNGLENLDWDKLYDSYTTNVLPENSIKQANDAKAKQDEIEAEVEAEEAVGALLGDKYGNITASDWDNMTQRQQFMWALANDEDLRNQLAGIDERFSAEDALGELNDETRDYSGNAYEIYRTLDRDKLEQAVNAVYGLWDDDDATGLRGWGDYEYGNLASDMTAADIAAYMIDNGVNVDKYLMDNANYDYKDLLGTDQATAYFMIDYMLNQVPTNGDNPLSNVFGGKDLTRDLAEMGLDTKDLALGLLALYQDKYGYLGDVDPTELNYLMSLGGERSKFSSVDEDSTEGRRKNYANRRDYSTILPGLATPVAGRNDENGQTVLDEYGNPVSTYLINDINPYAYDINPEDNPLLDEFLSDTFAAQYAEANPGKHLVQ